MAVSRMLQVGTYIIDLSKVSHIRTTSNWVEVRFVGYKFNLTFENADAEVVKSAWINYLTGGQQLPLR